MYTYSDDIISDLHKDARGYRPTEFFWEEWTQSPDSVKQEIWDMLCEEVDISMKEQEAAEAKALIEFRKLIRAVMDTASCNWKAALRYLVDGENLDVNSELDYFLWNQGIGFNDRNKISKLYKEAV